jgi:KamA family protein
MESISKYNEYNTEQKYKAYTLRSLEDIDQLKLLSEKEKEEMKIVANVFPFKTNDYVINELINWNNVPNDPIFQLTFPQRKMLRDEHFNRVKSALDEGLSGLALKEIVDKVRYELNPHPAGQKNYNVPDLNGENLEGMQHKYRETVLFFPSAGQTCHAYCSFCFRWPQFVGLDDQKFAMKEVSKLIEYLKTNNEISDVLFTGGDPMVMRSSKLRSYIEPLLDADISSLKTIRIGTKSLSYWPYRYLDDDGDDVIELFKQIAENGIHLSIMAHFNHYNELTTPALEEAVKRIRGTGAQIRTQSPILNHINADVNVWASMWEKQTALGMIPYYMFVVRDTGAKDYFDVPLMKAWQIYYDAYRQVSGISRTVRGPSMSCTYGKIAISGPVEVGNETALALKFIQARNPKWVGKPFLAKYDENASWIDELRPFRGDKFFFEDEIERYLAPYSRFKGLVQLDTTEEGQTVI